ncbi:MAG: type IV pilin protein [Azoarcus sp.]|nr:type IV pilin protein [Azoarcus sp.]
MTRIPTVRQAGFTLIELMIAVAIVGILIAVAFPSYQTYVAKSYRGKALACVVEHAQFMERFYTSNMTYVGAAPNLGCTTENDLNTRYTLAVNIVDQRNYSVTATPLGHQAKLEGRCGTLSIDQAGQRGASGSAGVAGCW